MKSHKFGIISVALAAWALPITIMIRAFTEWQLKSANAQRIDITSALAYTSSTMFYARMSLVVLLVLSVMLALVGLKKDAQKTYAKCSLAIALGVMAFVGVFLLISHQTRRVETRASQQQLQTFWQELAR